MENLPPAQPPARPRGGADRLISLAQDADRAGYVAAASNLVSLALAVFDEMPVPALLTH